MKVERACRVGLAWAAAIAGAGCLPEVDFTPCAQRGTCRADVADVTDARDASLNDLAEAEIVDGPADARDEPAEAGVADDLGDAGGARDVAFDGRDGDDVAEVAVDAAPDVIVCDAGATPFDGACATVAAPRMVAPLSTSTVTSQTPRLRWELASATDGARIELCRERACATVVHRFEATGSTTVTPMTLAPGVWFWRAAGVRAGVVGATYGPTWQFVVGHRSATVNTAWGSATDFNGDGYADLAYAVEGTVYVYAGTGAGLGASPSTIRFDPGSVAMLSGVGCDVNGDGFGDLLVTSRPASSATTYVAALHLGSPSGLSARPIRSFDPIVRAAHLLGDINGDGYGDIALDDYIALGGPSGAVDGRMTFTSPTTPSFAAPLGDVNGDGRGDVLLCTISSSSRLLMSCSAQAGSATTTLSPLGAGVPSTAGLRPVGDMDGDGRADFGGVTFVGTSIVPSVFWGGAFAPSFDTSPALLVGAAGDTNGDGFNDANARTSAAGTADFSRPSVVMGAAGRRLTITRPVLDPMGVDATTVAIVVSIGDIDGDTRDDLAVLERNLSRVYILTAQDIASTSRASRVIATPTRSADVGIVANQ